MEKSYQKKTAMTTVERNGSLGRASSKRSELNEIQNYVSDGRAVSYFNNRDGESLTSSDEK